MKLSVSVSKGAGNIKHNQRAHTKCPANIDSERSFLNVTLVDENIRDFYEREFGEAVADYNAKQKRSDRQIDDYYSKVAHDKKTKLFQELVVQVGNKDEQADDFRTTNELYKNFLDDFRKQYPQLKVIGAYIHNDEATPHMHIDYVPVATYERGLTKRVANNRALEQMGFDDWQQWHTSTMDLVTERLNELGIERDVKDNHNKHIERVAEFKELTDKKKELKQEIAELENQKIKSPARMVAEDFEVMHFLGEVKELIKEEVVQPHQPVSYGEGVFDGMFKKRFGKDEYVISGWNLKQIRDSYFRNVKMNEEAWHNHYLHEKVVREFKDKVQYAIDLVRRALNSPVQAIVNKYNEARLSRLEQENAELRKRNKTLESRNDALWRELHPQPRREYSYEQTPRYRSKNDDFERDKGMER